MKSFQKTGKKQLGATMIEYALIVALIAIAVIATVKGVGLEVANQFDQIKSELSAAGSSSSGT